MSWCFWVTLYLFSEFMHLILSTTQNKNNLILSKNLRGSVSLLHILVINYSTSKRLNVEQKYILKPIQGELREGLYDTYMSCYLQYMNSKKFYDNVETKTVLSTVSLTISTLWKKKCQRIQGTTWCLLQIIWTKIFRY